MYTIEALTAINRTYHAEHKVNQSDVDKANMYVSIIEKSRTNDRIQPGDIIELTTEHGDYYRNAHVDYFNAETGNWRVCEQPYVPFVSLSTTGDNITCCTSGGAWDNIPNNLQLVGKRKKLFKDWGHCGVCAHGAMTFEAIVNVWEYNHPKPLYGDYSTKHYKRHYISYCVDKLGYPRHGSPYRYFGNGIAFKTKEDYKAWVDALKGVEFKGNSPTQTVVFIPKRHYPET